MGSRGTTSKCLHHHVALPRWSLSSSGHQCMISRLESNASHHCRLPTTCNNGSIPWQRPSSSWQWYRFDDLSPRFHCPPLFFKPLIMRNILHVPHITRNFLSVQQFAHDNNVIFEFHPSSFLRIGLRKGSYFMGQLKMGFISYLSPIKDTPLQRS